MGNENYLNKYTEEDSLLPGWTMRTKTVKDPSYAGGVRKHRFFLTPHKKRNISTALGVLEYLRLQGKCKEDLESLAEHLEVNKTKFSRLYNDYYRKPASVKKVKLEQNLDFKHEADKNKEDSQERVKVKQENIETATCPFDENMEIDLEKSKYFGICSSVIRTNTPSLDINDFSEEDSLLPGWKIRIREDVKPYYTSHKNGLRRKKVYLTPHK